MSNTGLSTDNIVHVDAISLTNSGGPLCVGHYNNTHNNTHIPPDCTSCQKSNTICRAETARLLYSLTPLWGEPPLPGYTHRRKLISFFFSIFFFAVALRKTENFIQVTHRRTCILGGNIWHDKPRRHTYEHSHGAEPEALGLKGRANPVS